MPHLPWEDSAKIDREEVRAWLRSMSGRDLERTGRAAAYLISPAANQGHPPRSVFLVQLEESGRSGGDEISRNARMIVVLKVILKKAL